MWDPEGGRRRKLHPVKSCQSRFVDNACERYQGRGAGGRSACECATDLRRATKPSGSSEIAYRPCGFHMEGALIMFRFQGHQIFFQEDCQRTNTPPKGDAKSPPISSESRPCAGMDMHQNKRRLLRSTRSNWRRPSRQRFVLVARPDGIHGCRSTLGNVN
jgi:hypothetical protein